MKKVTFLPDNKTCEATNGLTLLEIAKNNNIPHVNACGGEGKCTTCRLLVLDGVQNCSSETEQEKVLKSKAHTTDEFRLACQTTISGDVTVRRLVLNSEDIESHSERSVSGRLGETKKIAILFSDIRGFTPFSEKLTPYDVVFILNRYFNRMVRVVESDSAQENADFYHVAQRNKFSDGTNMLVKLSQMGYQVFNISPNGHEVSFLQSGN